MASLSSFIKSLSNPRSRLLRLDTDRIEHGNRLLVPKLAAQDAGNREPTQRTAPHCADLDVIIRPCLGGCEALLEEAAPGMPDCERGRSQSPARHHSR